MGTGTVAAASGGITRPVLHYLGGKWRLADWIIGHFPRHECYVEPFGGGASVLLRKPPVRWEVYNDLDDDVVNLFRVLRDGGLSRRLWCQLYLTPFAQTELQHSREPAIDPVERARRLLVRSHMGFSGRGMNPGNHFGFRGAQLNRGGDHARSWSELPEALIPVVERLRRVSIFHKDAFALIDSYDSPRTLFYLDPPYHPETRTLHNSRYRYELADSDHERLLEKVAGLRAMVILSGYRNPLYDAALNGWVRQESTAYAATRGGSSARSECLWLNPACVAALEVERAQMPLFQDLVPDVAQTSP